MNADRWPPWAATPECFLELEFEDSISPRHEAADGGSLVLDSNVRRPLFAPMWSPRNVSAGARSRSRREQHVCRDGMNPRRYHSLRGACLRRHDGGAQSKSSAAAQSVPSRWWSSISKRPSNWSSRTPYRRGTKRRMEFRRAFSNVRRALSHRWGVRGPFGAAAGLGNPVPHSSSKSTLELEFEDSISAR